MIDQRTGKNLKDLKIAKEGQLRVYVMLNEIGKIKIGVSKNVAQRYQSLCGSNSQGNKIVKVCASPITNLNTLENIMHNKFKKYRISGTEWFYDKDNTGELTFDKVCFELEKLFKDPSYKKLNELRGKMRNGENIKDGHRR